MHATYLAPAWPRGSPQAFKVRLRQHSPGSCISLQLLLLLLLLLLHRID
jgi:hypothetical protein